MPRKGRKKKGSRAATSNGACSASQTTPSDGQPKDKKSLLQRNSTFRSIVQLAKHVVGIRKSDPSTAHMDDTQSTSSVYDTATGTSPQQEESLLSPLSRSARKRQKLRRGGMIKLQDFPIEDLSIWAKIVTDKSKSDKERANAASIINELVEKMSSYVDRLLARKLLSNWGVPAAVSEYGSGLGQEMGKFHEAVEADALLDEEGNSLDDWLGEVARKKSRNLQEVMRLLPTASEEALGEVQHLLLKRGRSLPSPTPSDPAHTPLSTAKSSNSAVLRAATPKSSRTFSVIISSPSTSTRRPSLDKPVPPPPPPPSLLSPPISRTYVPPAPPTPPPFLLGHGPPAAQLPSAGHGPPAPPPPPPPSLLRGGVPPPPAPSPPFSMPVQKDTWAKSCRTVAVRVARHRKAIPDFMRPPPSSFPNSGTVYADIDVNELPSSEQEELERLFKEKEQTKPILGLRSPRAADLPRIEGNRGVAMAISLSRFAKLAVKEIVDLAMSGRMSDDDAEQLIKGWPTDDELKKFGSLPKEQTTHDRNVAFVWEIANWPGAAIRIELMKGRLHQEEKLAVIREHLDIWEKAVDAMKNEPTERVLKKLLVWSNFLNQGSSLSQLTEISLCDVNVILQQKSTAERTTIGELLAKTLDLKRADLLPVKAALKETEKCQEETKLGQLEKELVDMERSIGLVMKRIETDASLKADFGDSVVKRMETVKELMEGVARVKKRGDEHKKFFREEEKTPLEELIRHECTALETLCTAIQVNAENQKASVLRRRSGSLADVTMGMESPFKRNHPLRKTTVAGDISSLAATLGKDLSAAVAKIRDKAHN